MEYDLYMVLVCRGDLVEFGGPETKQLKKKIGILLLKR